MRGKKDVVDESLENLIEEYEKRAPMGFHGMRGKKEDYDSKRAPMGFQGMRGKKDLQDETYRINTDFDKRAPMGFQGENENRSSINNFDKHIIAIMIDSNCFGTPFQQQE